MVKKFVIPDEAIYLLRGQEVESILKQNLTEVAKTVAAAYRSHASGETVVPPSSFLRFPGWDTQRIIALPAYLDRPPATAGIKWIASAPANIDKGLPRASAVVVLNRPDTGQAFAIVEGSHISAHRTAASAAVATQLLYQRANPTQVGLIACGLINSHIISYLVAFYPSITTVIIYDLQENRAKSFIEKTRHKFPMLSFETAEHQDVILQNCDLISIATTATDPYINDLSLCPTDTLILHVSLRDINPDAILRCNNVVDDDKHIMQANTSVHLAAQTLDSNEFINANIGDLLNDKPSKKLTKNVTIFSPFGLGVLDLAVASWVVDHALENNMGLLIDQFYK